MKQQIKAIICVLFGHSKIVITCFGYVYCARCGAQVGDALCGGFDARGCVIVDHDCATCHENYAALSWKDKLFVPNPLKKDA